MGATTVRYFYVYIPVDDGNWISACGVRDGADVRPLDPRLLKHARRAVVPIAVLAVLGLATALLVVAQAWLLARRDNQGLYR